MPPKTLLLGITVVAVLIIVGGVSWTLFGNKAATYTPPPNSNSGASTEPSTPSSDNTGQTTPDSTGSTSDNPNGSQTGNSTSLMSQEKVRDMAMVYVKGNHSDVASLMTNLTWSGGRMEPNDPANESYIYYSGYWTVTVTFPVSSESTYWVVGTYYAPDASVSFTGSYMNGAFRITGYTPLQRFTPQV